MRTFFLDIYDTLSASLVGLEWREFIFGLKIASFIVSGLLIIAAVILIYQIAKNK